MVNLNVIEFKIVDAVLWVKNKSQTSLHFLTDAYISISLIYRHFHGKCSDEFQFLMQKIRAR